MPVSRGANHRHKKEKACRRLFFFMVRPAAHRQEKAFLCLIYFNK